MTTSPWLTHLGPVTAADRHALAGLTDRYRGLEIERLELGASAGPRHRTEPGYSWLAYKEAFSPTLVRHVLDEWRSVDGPLMDAFAGSGTSLLVAAEREMESVGIELHPYAQFMSNALLRAHTAEPQEVMDIAHRAASLAAKSSTHHATEYAAAPAASWALSTEATHALRALSAALPARGSDVAVDLAHVALLSIVEKSSTSVKDGTSLRHRERNRDGRSTRPGRRGSHVTADHVRAMFLDAAQAIADGLPKLPDVGATVLRGDARRLPLRTETIGCAVFSPPYPNRYDYAAVYQLELAVGGFVQTTADLRATRKALLRSHLEAPPPMHDHVDDDIVAGALRSVAAVAKGSQAGRTLRMLWGYFQDMQQVLEEHARVMADGAPLGIVVATQTYYGQPVPTDLLLAHLAERAGYAAEGVWILRRKRVAVQQRSEATRSGGGRETVLLLRRTRRQRR